VGTTSRPPKWIKPQLTRLVDEAPTGKDWLHEIKYDSYRMHARIDSDKIQLLTRTEAAIESAGEASREALAIYLHDRHPRTSPSDKPGRDVPEPDSLGG
jgi:ATP-dependent DNA ligase